MTEKPPPWRRGAVPRPPISRPTVGGESRSRSKPEEVERAVEVRFPSTPQQRRNVAPTRVPANSTSPRAKQPTKSRLPKINSRQLVFSLLIFGLLFGGFLLLTKSNNSSNRGVDGVGTESGGTTLETSASQDTIASINEGDWDEVARAVVYIDASGSDCSWSGSGSIVGDGSLILTNQHVAGDGECNLTVFLTDSISDAPSESFSGEVIVSDQNFDLAVIQLKDANGNVVVARGRTPLQFADELPSLGEKLTILGYPGLGGSTITLTSGDFAGVYTLEENDFLKTTANMNPGVSGGAALNFEKKLVGVPTAGKGAEIACDGNDACTTNGSTIGLLRPIEYARDILKRALEKLGSTSSDVAFLDTSSESSVRKAAILEFSKTVPNIGWTGDTKSCEPGLVNEDFRSATLSRIKWYRAMAGLEIDISLSKRANEFAQSAALVMLANNQLSHDLDASWSCYTEAADEGASKSNLFLGLSGPLAIDGYIDDPGEDNFIVGHRRWILYSALASVGTGETPGSNALFVVNDEVKQDPMVRESQGFIMWPPRGYVPTNVIYDRWSVSHPLADFSDSEITISTDGEEFRIPDSDVLRDNQNYGDGPSLIFEFRQPIMTNQPVSVSVRDVKINGILTSLNHTVIPIEI